MFGNTKGWIISGVIVLFTGALLFMTARLPSISNPTGRFKLDQTIALPTDPKTLLPPMNSDCDAAELYRQAIHEYDVNEKDYEAGGRFEKSLKTAVEKKPKGIELIVQATDCNRMNLFTEKPEQVVHYNPTWPDLNALNQLGRRTVQFGMLLRSQKKLDEAERYLNAGFALGYRLYTERVIWEEINHGMNMMFEASTHLGRLAKDRGDESKSAAYAALAGEIDAYKKEKLVPLIQVVNSIQTDIVGKHGGDIIHLARQSPERMWRVEALLSMGRMKYNTNHRGDQIGARRELKNYLQEKDPAVREAARIADEMTVERYRMLGG